MSSDWESFPAAAHRRSNHLLVKIIIVALLVGVSFHLLFSRSDVFFPVPESSFSEPEESGPVLVAAGDAESKKDFLSNGSDAPASEEVPDVEEQASGQKFLSNGSNVPAREVASDAEEQISGQGQCDLFTGEWIPNPSGPAYTNATCGFIESPQNCMKNGRPDTGYLYWRWKPHGCNVSPLNAEMFLESMRNKRWALIGDSILRNHARSMICLLSKADEPVEVYHDEQFKSRRWLFRSYNFTLSLVWSPFLIKAEIFENDDGESKSENRLHIDTLDQKWTNQYNSFDYIVISGGQWFLKYAIYVENNTVVGCHYCRPKLNLTEYGLDKVYSKALNSLYRFITTNEHKPVVIYRTWTPHHFEHGEWFNGGICNRTAPYKPGEFDGRDIDHMMLNVELDEFGKALNALEDRTRLKLLNTYQLSMLRPDGHSGPYRRYHSFDKDKNVIVQNDCLHWCLPGPIDTWNDLLMALVSN